MFHALRPLLAALAALLTIAAPARAGWFPADAIDGPSPDIVAFGDIDIARDGNGGLVYVRNDGGVSHIYLSRHVAGEWKAPERIDAGIESGSSQPVIAAGDEDRLAIAWISGGRVYATVAPGGNPTPLPAPQQIYDGGDPLRPARDPHIDMGINGTAYVVFSAPGGGGSDVRAVRASATGWEQVAAPLDIVSDRAAGDGTGRPRVAVSAEGNAVAVWGEDHPDGRRRIYGRRITGTVLSVAPQQVSVDEFQGTPGGGAEEPDLAIEDDGSFAWAVFRQDIGGQSRAIARRLVGSLWEAPTAVDGGGGASTPRVGMTGRGVGIAVTGGTAHSVQASLLERDVFGPSLRVDATGSTAPPIPVAATSERDHSAMAWRATINDVHAEVRARHRPEQMPYEAETVISRPDFGPAAPDGLEIAQDRNGDFAVGFLQGGPAGRRVVVAEYDRPPGLPMGLSSAKPRRTRRPRLKWRPGADLWGAQLFKVFIDGQLVGQTYRSYFDVPEPLDDGPHTWQVIASDRRGQENQMRPRTLRIDATPPDLVVDIVGKRKAGQVLRIESVADDGDGSGLSYVEVDFGDRSKRSRATRVLHRYRRGKFKLAVKAVDKARNVTRKVFRLRIKK